MKRNTWCRADTPAVIPACPPPLRAGDKVAVVAPSSPLPDPDTGIENAVSSLTYLHLEPVIMAGCRMRRGHLAGSDEQRARDINAAFSQDSIKGLFCLRGGFGAMRILPLLDQRTISLHPKAFIGYSDITALHVFLNQRCGLITFHGPMAGTDYKSLDDFTLTSMKRQLLHPAGPCQIPQPPGFPMEALLPGSAEGILTGGNLTVLASSLGTPYEIDARGKILFLEDVDEPLYRLDRALTSLSLAGKFSDCAGVLLGTFERCIVTSGVAPHTLKLDDILRDLLEPLGKPVIKGLQAGHSYPQVTLPLGANVRMEAGRKGSIDESTAAKIFVL